ncbi:metal tolerance protein 9-like protein [Tanacetum coccineum]
MMEAGDDDDDTHPAITNHLIPPEPESSSSSWRLNLDHFRLPSSPPQSSSSSSSNPFFASFRRFFRPITPRKHGKVRDYYKKQERLLEGFNEMETINESGYLPDTLTDDEMDKLAKNERMAINISNLANLVLFIAKVYASIESRSLAVIASTLDSLLDLLSGFILWFTSHAMRNPNQYHYPIGKKRMQPVGIIVFASVMGTLGFQILLESARQLIAQTHPDMNRDNEKWVIGIMVSVTVVKFMLMVYCRRFKNEIVRAYAQDHLFDVVTNSVGLASTVLAIALYTISTWARTVMENVKQLIGRSAPPDFLAKLTYLIWNHHEEIKHIDTVRAYTFGSHYFVEVDIVLPEDMLLNKAHNIGEMLQEKLEQLPEVERAFVHIDFEFSHRPEHKAKDEMDKLAKNERMAINISNLANLVLFIAKVYASIESRSLAVIASTLDSLLDLLSGFILWFTSHAMRNPNQYHYPIGKKRMQPVGIIVFASVMGTLGFQILLESARQLIAQTHPDMNRDNEKWVIGIMVSVTVVKFMLMVYCRRFKNEIVRALYDPWGIVIALYTISTWARTVMENVKQLIGRSAPPDFLAKLTYLIWNHHEEIKHIDTVRAYTFGSHYFVEVDIVLPEDMLLNKAHNIGEMLQEKLEQLPEVERAFVHIDFEFSHRPEHKPKV